MKKFILIFGPLLLLAATGVGLAVFGVIDIPGVTPVQKQRVVDASKDQAGGLLWTLIQPASSVAKQMDDAAKVAQKAASKLPPPPTSTIDPDLGDAKLAMVWNDLDVDQLQKITTKWQPAAVAKILGKMDGDQVTKYLDAIDPARADQICRAMQAIASKVPLKG